VPPAPKVDLVPVGDVGAPRKDINWPPRPTFTILSDRNNQRAKELGSYEWVATGPNGAVKILGNWVEHNIVTVDVPQLARFRNGNSKVRFHKRAAEQFKRLWAAWENAGLLDRIITYDGDFVPRVMRSNNRVLSNHAYGTAFDINAKWNWIYKVAALYGEKGCVRELVPLANAHGFYWGGHWNYDGKGASDGMHFEWAVPA
jgi:hypothetical protein